jgi:clan AA aspartic protease (TIGR02281 family)
MEFRLVSPDKPIIMVKAKVNSKGPFNFAVDTGASVTAISKQTAEKLGISLNPSIPKKGRGCCGDIDMSLVSVKSVQVGDIMVKDLQVALMDLSVISEGLGIEVEGIIGYSFMKDYRVIIDYPLRKIYFEKA